MAISFKGAHFPQDIIRMGVRWYVAYPSSYRHVEELMEGSPTLAWSVSFTCLRAMNHITS